MRGDHHERSLPTLPVLYSEVKERAIGGQCNTPAAAIAVLEQGAIQLQLHDVLLMLLPPLLLTA